MYQFSFSRFVFVVVFPQCMFLVNSTSQGPGARSWVLNGGEKHNCHVCGDVGEDAVLISLPWAWWLPLRSRTVGSSNRLLRMGGSPAPGLKNFRICVASRRAYIRHCLWRNVIVQLHKSSFRLLLSPLFLFLLDFFHSLPHPFHISSYRHSHAVANIHIQIHRTNFPGSPSCRCHPSRLRQGCPNRGLLHLGRENQRCLRGFQLERDR